MRVKLKELRKVSVLHLQDEAVTFMAQCRDHLMDHLHEHGAATSVTARSL
jgi:uncharacterized protein YpbB